MWKNIVERDRTQMTIWRMCIARWITKATNRQSEYVLLIASHYNNGCTNAPHCYVIRTLCVLFNSTIAYPYHNLPVMLFLFVFVEYLPDDGRKKAETCRRLAV